MAHGQASKQHLFLLDRSYSRALWAVRVARARCAVMRSGVLTIGSNGRLCASAILKSHQVCAAAMSASAFSLLLSREVAYAVSIAATPVYKSSTAEIHRS